MVNRWPAFAVEAAVADRTMAFCVLSDPSTALWRCSAFGVAVDVAPSFVGGIVLNVLASESVVAAFAYFVGLLK